MAHTSKTEVRQSESIGFEPSSPPADAGTVVASEGRRSALVEAPAGLAAAIVAVWLAAALLAIHQSPSYAVLISLGFTGAFVAGLVGVGGAILMIPLLLYVAPLFGIDRLPFHTVAGVEMIQVATAGIVGALAHRREGKVNGALVATIGPGMVVAALVGAIVSRFVSAGLLTVVFASLALVAGLVMLDSRRRLPPETPLH
ncbi:MAG: sulfite exporter TauE/SafE family protein, partial [Acidobacteriota bacterium]